MKNNIFNIFYLFIYIFFVLKKYFLKLEWRINLLWRIWILSYKETLEPRFWGRSWLPGVCDVLQSNFNATVTLMFAFCKTNVVYQIIRSCEPDNRISQRHRSLHRAESNRSSTVPRTTTQTSSRIPTPPQRSLPDPPSARRRRFLSPSLSKSPIEINSEQRNRKQKWRPSTFHWMTRPSEWEICSRASTPPILPCPPPPIRRRLPPNAPPSTPSTTPPSIPTSTWISWFALTLCCLCSELKCRVLVEMSAI